jgi:Zn-dependent membrane protease YugP
MFFDHYYVILVLPAIALSLWAQFMVSSAFNKYSKVESRRRISGEDAAEALLRMHNIGNVSIQGVQGRLTDHYDPGAKVLRLSEPVYRRTSIAAIGVAAHETGHAFQDAERYGPLVLRSALVPVANLGSRAGPLLVIIGIIASFGLLTQVGVILFAASVLFYFITLPVEINASRRALAMLESSKMLESDELTGVKKVLTAAAFTYVASAILALANLIRLVLLSRNRRRSSW